MKYTEVINKSIEFIEDNLKNDINCREIANNVGYSLYHFNRMFLSLTGETPGNYLRKRRLTESSKQLKTSDEKIINISLDYCFGSQEAFTRSFKNMFNINPLEYRNSDTKSLILFEKLLLEPSYEVVDLNYRIEKREKMYVVGLDTNVTGKDFNYVALWEKFMTQYYFKIQDKIDITIGLAFYPETFPDPWEYSYMPSVQVNKIDDIPLGLSLKTIPAAEYIAFTHKGPKEKITQTYDYVYSKGLSELGYKSCSNFDFEYYDQRFNDKNPEVSEMDIFVPIKLI